MATPNPRGPCRWRRFPKVDPAATPTGTSRTDDLAWLVPAAATTLLLPVALLALRRRTRR